MKSQIACAVTLGTLLAGAAVPDPVLYYSFDALKSDALIAEETGKGTDLALGSGAVLTNFAARGNALWFDGTQAAYARFMSPAVTNRTISFWYWRDSDPGAYFRENWADDSNTNPRMPTLIADLNGFYVRFNNNWIDSSDFSLGLSDMSYVTYFGTGGPLGAWYVSYGKFPLVGFERWAHIAYTIDVTNRDKQANGNFVDSFDVAMYVNGEKWYAASGVTTNICSFKTATLGNGNTGTKERRPCHGALDELKVWDCVLTEDQIHEEYERAPDAVTGQLIAHYPMQEFTSGADGTFTTPDATAYGRSKGLVLTCSAETSVTNGPAGTDKALHFQGTYGTVASGTIPRTYDDFTVSVWVNVSTNTSVLRVAGETANYPMLIMHGPCSRYYFNWAIDSLKMQYKMPSNDGGTSGIHSFNTKGLLGKGMWQLMTFVVRNVRDTSAANARTQMLDLYINGEFIQSGPAVKAATTARNAALILGSVDAKGSNRPFEGDVADLRIYAGAFDAARIRRLFRSAAAVDAGTDATVAGSKAVLVGTVAARNGVEPWRTGYDGDVRWECVSAPQGGEAVTFARPGNPVTEATLPVEGAYVFRLTTIGFAGLSQSDTVTVTRNDATGAEPVVPVADTVAAVSNATLCAGLTNGLTRYWKVNEHGLIDNVSGSQHSNFTPNWSYVTLASGVTGYGFRSIPGVLGTLTDEKGFATKLNSGESAGSPATAAGNYPISNEWFTVSAWIRPESDFPADWYAGAIAHIDSSLSVCYGKYKWNCGACTGPEPGFSILQTGFSGAQSWVSFDLPAAAALEDKWSHVVAIVNRHDTSKSCFYLNGSKLTENATYKSVGNYSATDARVAPYGGTPLGGRYLNSVTIGNVRNDRGGVNNIIYQMSNTTTAVTYRRYFPGTVDEVRFYTRQLTEPEIGFLATHPDPDANEAPVVAKTTPSGTVWTAKKRTNAIIASAADDGNGTAAVTYRWSVLKGDASACVFTDATAAETTVRVMKPGVYAFALTATDGERTTTGEPCEVTVAQAGMVVILN